LGTSYNVVARLVAKKKRTLILNEVRKSQLLVTKIGQFFGQ